MILQFCINFNSYQNCRHASIFQVFSLLLQVWFDFTRFTANPLPDLPLTLYQNATHRYFKYFHYFCRYGLTLPDLQLTPYNNYRHAKTFKVFSQRLQVWFDFTGFTANPLPELPPCSDISSLFTTFASMV